MIASAQQPKVCFRKLGEREMLRLFAVVLFLILGSNAWAIDGTLQGDFSCPAKNCTSICDGPSGHRVITSYSRLSVWVVTQPPRTWLQLDNGTQIMLGISDGCVYAGASTPITPVVQPPEQVPFNTPDNPEPHSPTICSQIPGHPQQCP